MDDCVCARLNNTPNIREGKNPESECNISCFCGSLSLSDKAIGTGLGVTLNWRHKELGHIRCCSFSSGTVTVDKYNTSVTEKWLSVWWPGAVAGFGFPSFCRVTEGFFDGYFVRSRRYKFSLQCVGIHQKSLAWYGIPFWTTHTKRFPD